MPQRIAANRQNHAVHQGWRSSDHQVPGGADRFHLNDRNDMLIDEIPEQECLEVFAHASIGRLGCAQDNQAYVVPVYLAYEAGYIYVFSTFGKKIEWMRANPKVCVEVDEIDSQSNWVSVIANGRYEELPDPQRAQEREHARTVLEKRHRWWLNALAERRIQLRDQMIEPVFFRIQIESVTGLRGFTGKEDPRAEDPGEGSAA
jgi:nitroimidazol reductase NimA-like FMN-containing flavoprotein (pyridoxamine 5'-phosphate oxidase superfamily)